MPYSESVKMQLSNKSKRLTRNQPSFITLTEIETNLTLSKTKPKENSKTLLKLMEYSQIKTKNKCMTPGKCSMMETKEPTFKISQAKDSVMVMVDFPSKMVMVLMVSSPLHLAEMEVIQVKFSNTSLVWEEWAAWDQK